MNPNRPFPHEMLAMRPIRLHLDTSDYAAMYRAEPGTMPARVRDELMEMVGGGRIEIGLSYHVFFELMRKAEPKHREDRLKRAGLLKELCGRNAFPYPTDLPHGPAFSTEGLWLPRIDIEEIEIERVVESMMRAIALHPEVTRHELRVLSKRKYFARWASDNPARFAQFAQQVWPLKFGTAFVESGDLRRYVSEEVTRNDANLKLRFDITDPVIAYEVWFERYGRDDPIAERRNNIASHLVLVLQEVQSMLGGAADLHARVKEAIALRGDDALSADGRERLLKLRADLKAFRAEITSPQELCERVPRWKELLGGQASLVAAQILFAFHREKRAIKQSDGIDFVHAMYLPYCDLWRGDKAFSDLLIKHRVNFCERAVPTLASVPERIEIEIGKLRAVARE
ncbi:MAG: hypothetical protein ABR929_13935 [Roseiarcus sp.]